MTYTQIKVISCKLLIIMVLCYIYCNISEVYLCDDGLIPSNSDFNQVSNNIASYSWETNYRGQNIPLEYSTHYSDGRPMYKAYNLGLQETYRTHYSNGTPIYQPYNDGLQGTIHGYRYELSGSSAVNTGPEPFFNELDGKSVDLQYVGVDIQGNPVYQYISVHNSTQLGEIGPTRSEVLNDGYYHGTGFNMPLDTSNTTLKRRLYNKVKVGIKNHIAKSNDEYLYKERIHSENLARRIHDFKKMSKAHDSRRVINMLNSKPSTYKSIRRFD